MQWWTACWLGMQPRNIKHPSRSSSRMKLIEPSLSTAVSPVSSWSTQRTARIRVRILLCHSATRSHMGGPGVSLNSSQWGSRASPGLASSLRRLSQDRSKPSHGTDLSSSPTLSTKCTTSSISKALCKLTPIGAQRVV